MGQNPILLNGAEALQGIHDTSTTPKHRVGTRADLPDGRTFRYARADSTGYAAGLVMQSPALVTANHVNRSVVAASIGSTSAGIAIGATAATADQYADGFFWINDGTGEGHVYSIKSHPANAGSLNLFVELNDPIKVAIVASATSEASLVANAYNGFVIAVAAASVATKLIGVTQVAFAASAYGWLQTRGLCSVLASGTGPTVALGLVTGASGTATVVTAVDAGQIIGTCVHAETASGDQCLVYLTLD